jgi:AbrB family transcriptional regulator, transcriptional pleiotropic regulator of transition state genes
MRDTGIVRRVDELGRIVIPMELRRTLGINVKDPIAIYTEGDRIILEKSKDSCALCGSETDVTTVKGRAVCAKCVADIKKL